jgi:hypothetical protein
MDYKESISFREQGTLTLVLLIRPAGRVTYELIFSRE